MATVKTNSGTIYQFDFDLATVVRVPPNGDQWRSHYGDNLIMPLVGVSAICDGRLIIEYRDRPPLFTTPIAAVNGSEDAESIRRFLDSLPFCAALVGMTPCA